MDPHFSTKTIPQPTCGMCRVSFFDMVEAILVFLPYAVISAGQIEKKRRNQCFVFSRHNGH